MTSEAVIVTGAAGGIGSAICRRFLASGYRVIGIDVRASDPASGFETIEADLARLGIDRAYRTKILTQIDQCLDSHGVSRLKGLVNNAAVQIIKPVEELTADELSSSMEINVVAPFVLCQHLYKRLAEARGCIVNIGSIHSRLTKPGFAAYSTSKSALSALTRALALEWGSHVRVTMIEPAAIATPMLDAGFAERPDARIALDTVHPSGTIGTVEHVADWVHHLLADDHLFSNGTVINLDGGISSRLHDPL